MSEERKQKFIQQPCENLPTDDGWLCVNIGTGGHAPSQVLSIISVTSEKEEEEKGDRGRRRGRY